MKKRTILIISILIIILVMGGVYIYKNQNIQKNDYVKVGDALFTLPEGFHEVNSTDNGVKISDGANNLMIFNYNDNQIDKYVDQYKNNKSAENISVTLNNFTVGDYWVYKSNAEDNPYVVHYWFAFNHKIYSIYTEDGNKNTDNIVSNLIKTMKNA